jgi:hypothetical protein
VSVNSQAEFVTRLESMSKSDAPVLRGAINLIFLGREKQFGCFFYNSIERGRKTQESGKFPSKCLAAGHFGVLQSSINGGEIFCRLQHCTAMCSQLQCVREEFLLNKLYMLNNQLYLIHGRSLVVQSTGNGTIAICCM